MSTSERATAAGDLVAKAHARLLADASLQFRFTPVMVSHPPGWLPGLLKMLNAFGPVLRILFWIVVAALVLALVYFIVRGAMGYRRRYKAVRLGGPSLGPDPDSLRPQAGRARALLGEADRLAAEQRFEEAAHVLLFRTIEDLEGRRPRAVRPALTSRDIAALTEIPTPARVAFAIIADLVERSFFGGRSLSASEFATCRGAYTTFASSNSWTVGARP